MNEKTFNTANLDFEKLNETLANPEFANWYYHKIIDNSQEDTSLEGFIKTIQDYSNNEFK